MVVAKRSPTMSTDSARLAMGATICVSGGLPTESVVMPIRGLGEKETEKKREPETANGGKRIARSTAPVYAVITKNTNGKGQPTTTAIIKSTRRNIAPISADG